MGSITAVFRNGQIELAEPVDWPDGTRVEVTPINNPQPRIHLLSLPPLDVGEFRELSADDDLLGEMLDDSRD
jgi:hypothetical protein